MNGLFSRRVDMEKHMMKIKVFTPLMRLDFDYKAGGKILVIAVQGDGPANIELGTFYFSLDFSSVPT